MPAAQSASVPIHVRGRYLWRGDERVCIHPPPFLLPSRGIRYTKQRSNLVKFVVRGVAYQVSHTHDPIADDCLLRLEHDVALFKELRLNTLYVCKCEYPPGFLLRR
jgi:hypothetical protein